MVCPVQRKIIDSHGVLLHTENFFLNINDQNETWIEITPFRLIWHQSKFCLVPNRLEKCN